MNHLTRSVCTEHWACHSCAILYLGFIDLWWHSMKPLRAGLSIPEALGKLSIGGPSQLMSKTKKEKRSSPPQIVEFECISDQSIV